MKVDQTEVNSILMLAFANGIQSTDFGNGHLQFVGKLTVNYWPFSKNRTAHIKDTKKTFANFSPLNAITLAKVGESLLKSKPHNAPLNPVIPADLPWNK
jgi:hypothetical protein